MPISGVSAAAAAAAGGPRILARTAAGQSVPNTTPTTVVFGTEDYDEESEYNPATGEYTAGEAGAYHIHSYILIAQNTAFDVGEVANLMVYVDGVANVELGRWIAPVSGENLYVVCWGGATISLAANEVVTIKAWHNSGSARALYASDDYNWVSIDFVG